MYPGNSREDPFVLKQEEEEAKSERKSKCCDERGTKDCEGGSGRSIALEPDKSEPNPASVPSQLCALRHLTLLSETRFSHPQRTWGELQVRNSSGNPGLPIA
ncbi:uncharacterized protein LOC106994652 [Macaca mulatta]